MAKRDALRDLQLRLAKRLQAALSPVQPVPYTKPWFKGVLNIRGSLLTLNVALDVNCALQIDLLAGLRARDAFVSSRPAVGAAPVWFGHCHVDAGGQAWQELNLQALSHPPLSSPTMSVTKFITQRFAALVKAIQTDTQDAIGAVARSTHGVVLQQPVSRGVMPVRYRDSNHAKHRPS